MRPCRRRSAAGSCSPSRDRDMRGDSKRDEPTSRVDSVTNDPQEQRRADAVWRASERVLAGGHPRRWDEDADRYGAGPAAERLHARIAELLGKEAAVWLPSGTMAQQVALRIHADPRGSETVAVHP